MAGKLRAATGDERVAEAAGGGRFVEDGDTRRKGGQRTAGDRRHAGAWVRDDDDAAAVSPLKKLCDAGGVRAVGKSHIHVWRRGVRLLLAHAEFA